jgi:hypothetical protein
MFFLSCFTAGSASLSISRRQAVRCASASVRRRQLAAARTQAGDTVIIIVFVFVVVIVIVIVIVIFIVIVVVVVIVIVDVVVVVVTVISSFFGRFICSADNGSKGVDQPLVLRSNLRRHGPSGHIGSACGRCR